MDAYVFASQAAAQACADAVDAQLGYPKAGTNVGSGVHVAPAFVTQTYQTVIAHPTLALWAYPSDAVNGPALAANAITLSLPTVQTLDATWTPSASVIP